MNYTMKALIVCSIAFIFTINPFSQWVQLSTGITADLQDICFIDLNTGIAAGNNGTLIRTTNSGSNWTPVTCPVTQPVYSMCFPSASTGYASGNTGFIIKTSNSGLTWFSVSPCSINVRAISFINSMTGITGGSGTLMCYTTDGGSDWNPRFTPTPHAVTGLHYFNSSLLLVSATDMPGAVLHKSTNGAATFSTVLTQTNSGLNIVYTLSSVYSKDENTCFATGSYTNNSQTWSRIYRSTNAGNNWETAANAGPASGSSLMCIHFGDGQSGFAAGNNGMILRSTNGGANWEQQYSGVTVNLTGIFMLNALTGYACGPGGQILKTTNGGISGLQPVNNEVPEKFVLFQNYPNPFNPSTKIKFSIPKVGDAYMRPVQITIYDALGREVATLVNEKLKPGTYEVTWDASNFSSGLYNYKLEIDASAPLSIGYTITKKMILVK
jgi:photosystem II stability/assembly factor-like uncharacterized protein